MPKLPKFSRSTTISKRLIMYIVLTSSLITFFISTFQLYREYTKELSVIDESINQIRTVHADGIAAILWTLDYGMLETAVSGIHRLNFVKRIAVIEGGLETMTVGEPLTEEDASHTIPLTVMHRGVPQAIGQLMITVDLEPVYLGLLERGAEILVSNAIKTAMVVIFMLMIIDYVLVRHLREISQYIGAFQANEPSAPLALSRPNNRDVSNDELDVIVKLLNAANQRIQEEFFLIKEAETKVRDYAEVSSDWFWEMDENLNFSYVSEQISEITGFDPADIIGARREYFVRQENNSAGVAKWEEHQADLEAHRPFKDFEYSFEAKNGNVISAQISGTPVFDADDNFVGYRGTGTDITRRVQADNESQEKRNNLEALVAARTAEVQEKANHLEQALESEKKYSALQKQFVSLVSHEIRTPLSIIDSAAQRIKRNKDGASPDKLAAWSENIRKAVERLIELIDVTLYASRLDADKIEMCYEPCALSDLIHEVCDRHQEISPSHEINLDLDGLPAHIQGDARLLEHVFTNLLSNAVKFAPDASLIEVRGRTSGEDVLVTVQDYGIGISDDDLPSMFERYFRADTARGIRGTGIGLSVCKEFVEMHGGSISVDSTEGEGSAFTVRLPSAGNP